LSATSINLAEPAPLAVPRIARAWARWVGLVCGLAMLTGAAWWVANSTAFDVRSVKVSGNRHLTATQVVRLAAVGEGTNTLWLSTGEVERRLLDNPWVLRATVSRSLPSSVTIEIEERTAVAMTASTSPKLVAADGVVLGPAPRTSHLPVISSRSASSLAGSPELAVAATLSRRIRPLVATIATDAEGQLILTLRDGVPVRYGDASRASEKADALRAILGWSVRNGVEPQYIDVRAPAMPALLPPGVPMPASLVTVDHSLR
jgi:cell division protein FtsQ